MNYPAAPSSGISASLRQATGYQPQYFFIAPRDGESTSRPTPADWNVLFYNHLYRNSASRIKIKGSGTSLNRI